VPVIAAEAMRLTVGNRLLLDGVSFGVEKGEVVAVLGANGVGKTTLLRAVAGLHPLSAGSLRVAGCEVSSMNPLERAKRVAFMTSDDAALESMSVREVVAMGRHPYHRWWEWSRTGSDEDAIDAALEAVALQPLAHRDVRTLSTGERQRCWLALGLAQGAAILLLDEPTSHLDIRFAQQILGLMRELATRAITVLAVLHDPNEAAAFADKLLLLGPGSALAFGTPAEALTETLLEETYGTPMGIVRTTLGLHVVAGARTKA